MANVFKKAKQLRKSNPNKSWQQLVKLASKKTAAKKPAAKKKAAKKKAAKKVGAYKVIEKNETKQTRPTKTVRVKRSKKGLFQGMQVVSGISQDHAIQRVIMKRFLKSKGISVATNIADNELQNIYNKTTSKGLPNKSHIREQLNKGVAPQKIISSYLK